MKLERKLKLSPKEFEQIKSFKTKKRIDEGIDVNLVNNDITEEFTTSFLATRGVDDPSSMNSAIWEFEDVAMHIDNINKRKNLNLLFLIEGSGELQYFDSESDYKDKFISRVRLKPLDAIAFLDILPHSFSAESKCKALISSVPTKYFK
jgi:hypothetical protein